jgi:protein-S-isoprenylcysteine O-methyltransferase Ste14
MDRMNWGTIDGEAERWLGVLLIGIGCELRLWPVFVLGQGLAGSWRFSQGHTLVTDGIDSIVRNPSYVGLPMSALGWA